MQYKTSSIAIQYNANTNAILTQFRFDPEKQEQMERQVIYNFAALYSCCSMVNLSMLLMHKKDMLRAVNKLTYNVTHLQCIVRLYKGSAIFGAQHKGGLFFAARHS